MELNNRIHQLPTNILHKAKEKYEVGKVYDELEAKQRRLRAILNKLTSMNLERLFTQVLEINIDTKELLDGFVSLMFNKALMEPTFCGVYADFCVRAVYELPDFYEDCKWTSVKSLLLSKCQEEFERGKKGLSQGSSFEDNGSRLADYERALKGIKARKRSLGNIRFVGELYRRKMLAGRVLHGCIKDLLGQCENGTMNEENIEGFCVLISITGEILDHPKDKDYVDAYFNEIHNLLTNNMLSSRIKFMLMDVIDLRKKKWQRRNRNQDLEPWMVLHKSYSRYIAGRVFNSEEIRQRKIRAILNKVTHCSLKKMLAQILRIGIFTEETLDGLVSQIFDKALMERTYCALYAELCYLLAYQLPDHSKGYETLSFKRILVNKCQTVFESRENGNAEVNSEEVHLEIEQCVEAREKDNIKQRARFLGNIRLIGELYRRKMLSERIIHECIRKLLGYYQNLGEEDIEGLCILISNIGDLIDQPKAKEDMDTYFDMILKLSTTQTLSCRLRFMLLDVRDLRINKWQGRKALSSPTGVDRNANHTRQQLSGRFSCKLRAESRSRYVLATEKNQLMPKYFFAGSEDGEERSKSTEQVYFRESSDIIEITSSTSDVDEQDYNENTSSCLNERTSDGSDTIDNDCVILEPETCLRSVDINKLTLSDHQEDDISIIAEKGQVACRDYPHSRHLCFTYPFSKTDHANHCEQCYCYVCDTPAPCEHWQGETGHCHATDRDEEWNELRRSRRLSSTSESS